MCMLAHAKDGIDYLSNLVVPLVLGRGGAEVKYLEDSGYRRKYNEGLNQVSQCL